jgi:hypothetical protein
MTNQPIPTTEKLAIAMTEAGCPESMIARARAGHYDDFKSSLVMPIRQLIVDLQALGKADLARRAIDGEFDATPEESEAWWKSEGEALLLQDLTQSAKRNKPRGFGN